MIGCALKIASHSGYGLPPQISSFKYPTEVNSADLPSCDPSRQRREERKPTALPPMKLSDPLSGMSTLQAVSHFTDPKQVPATGMPPRLVAPKSAKIWGADIRISARSQAFMILSIC
jgi:hypothetical protein